MMELVFSLNGNLALVSFSSRFARYLSGELRKRCCMRRASWRWFSWPLSINGTKNNAKELDQRIRIDQMCVMLLEPLRGQCIAEDGRMLRRVAGQCIFGLTSLQVVSKGRVLCFSHCLRAFNRLLWLFLLLFQLTQRIKGAPRELIKKRERDRGQEGDT